MAPYAQSREALAAIAQHYGIPTTLLDVTRSPDISVLFSKVSGEPIENGFSVVYCFSESDIRRTNGVDIVEINVANLWRLEVQQGLFVDFVDGIDVPDIRSLAIRIHFPSVAIAESEKHYLYPTRKSALENVLDQWFYRHEIETVTSAFSEVPYNMPVKRYSYPGAFTWRSVPEFHPEWVSQAQEWFAATVEPEAIIRTAQTVSISLPSTADIAHASARVRHAIEKPIHASSKTGQFLTFMVEGDRTVCPLISNAEKLINRVWDGIRLIPYKPSELVSCLSTVASVVLLRAIGCGGIDDWHKKLWGETDLLEVAPVGGHIEAGVVSRERLEGVFTKRHYGDLATHYRQLAKDDPRNLMKFVVDPWILFDFERFKSIYIEQFIPSAVDGYWKEDISQNDGDLECMWSVPFNPALLAYVTNMEYRFYSPLAHENDIDHIVYILPDMTFNDIEEAFVYCHPHILNTGSPFQVRFPGYEFDSREIWEIDEAIRQCKEIVAVSGISVLEVCTSGRDPEQSTNPLDVPGLGAFEIWLIARGLLKEAMGKPMKDIQSLIEEFKSDLLIANADLDARAKAFRQAER